MPHHFIFGCGFLGTRLADRFVLAGDHVSTVTRSEAKAAALQRRGIAATAGNFQHWETSPLAALPSLDSITICVGNDNAAAEDHRSVYRAATQAALALSQRPQQNSPARLLFVSTTGVYAQPDPDPDSDSDSNDNASLGWVDETGATQDMRGGAMRGGAIASLECETQLRQQAADRAYVFRLAGIYHLERIPNLKKMQNGEALTGDGSGWLNLIHVDDAANILAFAAAHRPPFPVFNVSDGQPVTRRDFYEFLSQQFRTPPPVFSHAGANRGGSKRISNQRLQTWYTQPWRFPSYRQGLVPRG